MTKRLDVANIRNWLGEIKAGDCILLSGTVYSARDAAHKRFSELLERGLPLPIDINDAVIYYCGPTPARPENIIGSCGPTTSSRMDPYTPELMRLGLAATIGKGSRSKEVSKAITETGGGYFCAVGGAGALAAQSIISVETVAFSDLGCEAVKRMVFKDFPLLVGIDSCGGSLFH